MQQRHSHAATLLSLPAEALAEIASKLDSSEDR
jgi:hypothetical protein